MKMLLLLPLLACCCFSDALPYILEIPWLHVFFLIWGNTLPGEGGGGAFLSKECVLSPQGHSATYPWPGSGKLHPVCKCLHSSAGGAADTGIAVQKCPMAVHCGVSASQCRFSTWSPSPLERIYSEWGSIYGCDSCIAGSVWKEISSSQIFYIVICGQKVTLHWSLFVGKSKFA